MGKYWNKFYKTQRNIEERPYIIIEISQRRQTIIFFIERKNFNEKCFCTFAYMLINLKKKVSLWFLCRCKTQFVNQPSIKIKYSKYNKNNVWREKYFFPGCWDMYSLTTKRWRKIAASNRWFFFILANLLNLKTLDSAISYTGYANAWTTVPNIQNTLNDKNDKLPFQILSDTKWYF